MTFLEKWTAKLQKWHTKYKDLAGIPFFYFYYRKPVRKLCKKYVLFGTSYLSLVEKSSNIEYEIKLTINTKIHHPGENFNASFSPEFAEQISTVEFSNSMTLRHWIDCYNTERIHLHKIFGDMIKLRPTDL